MKYFKEFIIYLKEQFKQEGKKLNWNTLLYREKDEFYIKWLENKLSNITEKANWFEERTNQLKKELSSEEQNKLKSTELFKAKCRHCGYEKANLQGRTSSGLVYYFCDICKNWTFLEETLEQKEMFKIYLPLNTDLKEKSMSPPIFNTNKSNEAIAQGKYNGVDCSQCDDPKCETGCACTMMGD